MENKIKIEHINHEDLKKLEKKIAHLSICYDTYKMAMRHYNGAVPENKEEKDFIYEEKSYLRKQMRKVEEQVFDCLAEAYQSKETQKWLDEVKIDLVQREIVLAQLLGIFFEFNGEYTLC